MQKTKRNALVNPLGADFTKWSNTLKQFVGNLLTNCLSVFGHFLGLALKGLRFLFFFDSEELWVNLLFVDSVTFKVCYALFTSINFEMFQFNAASVLYLDRVQLFKNGLSKICGRQPLKNLEGYG